MIASKECIFVLNLLNDNDLVEIIALWGWFSRDVTRKVLLTQPS